MTLYHLWGQRSSWVGPLGQAGQVPQVHLGLCSCEAQAKTSVEAEAVVAGYTEAMSTLDTISLKVFPKTALVDEPVRIQVWGLQPQQRITLRAWLKDETGEIFYSRAFYISDKKGKVDLKHLPATGGDFQGLYPMGLFWALKSSTPYQRLIKNHIMGSPLHVHLEVYSRLEMDSFPDTPPAATTSVERWFAAPGVQGIEVRHGRIRGGLLLPPGEGPFPGVIDIYSPIAALIDVRPFLLASRGFAVLSLAYYGYDDLPKSPDHVDLDYFEEAVNFLVNHPKVSSAGVRVIGLSKGAEIALAMACFIPRIVATVCINGTICVTGQDLRYGDLTIRAIPHQEVRFVINILTDPKYLANLDSILPIERAKSPILFLVGENDLYQNSMFYAELSKTRAEVLGKKDVYLRSFSGAGHIFEPPGYPLYLVFVNPVTGVSGLWGKELMWHCKAQELSWWEALHFLHSYIPCSQPNK
ncbi:acyl-coenzyme A amino acid N-acyltransferase 1-like [Leptodactylus fuscus]|uniref:acyl-coenzyme A amino acid N-acyltransferase 1-like n=1 Tax=Leptodactylus fuscus TaxID=238119 RepID=UPI003F4F3E98